MKHDFTDSPYYKSLWKAHEVLESGTFEARALKSTIDSFYKIILGKNRIGTLKSEVAKLKARANKLKMG